MELSAQDSQYLIKVACFTIRRRLEGGKTPPIVVSNPAILKPAGCFVSLHGKSTHTLRGCIGRIDASSPLLMVLGNVAWQVITDPRFNANPITLAELPELTIELSILGMLTPRPKPLDFEPLTDGLYLSIGPRAGVFLPQVARDTGWSREQLLDRLCQEKMGLPPRLWQDPAARLFTFPSQTIGPVDFVFEDLPATKQPAAAAAPAPASA
jgi:AmmeMemoRadiSam system protein A